MSATVAGDTDPRRRFCMILAVFVTVVPLGTGALGLALLLAVPIMSVAFDAPLTVFGFCALLGLPVAVVAGLLFAAVAAWRNNAPLWVALAPAVLMPPLVTSVLGLRMFPVDWTLAGPLLVLTMLPLLLAWAVSRRWH